MLTLGRPGCAYLSLRISKRALEPYHHANDTVRGPSRLPFDRLPRFVPVQKGGSLGVDICTGAYQQKHDQQQRLKVEQGRHWGRRVAPATPPSVGRLDASRTRMFGGWWEKEQPHPTVADLGHSRQALCQHFVSVPTRIPWPRKVVAPPR